MAHVTQENITGAVVQSFDHSTNERFRFVISGLVNHLHQFAREVSLTHDEWREGLVFLTHTSRFTDLQRNEFVLIADVLGLCSLVDLRNSSPGSREGSVLSF